MSKRPMGHGDLRNMGNFKAVAIDYEYYLTLSDQPVSVCLTERQMYVLSVQNTYTAWLTRWYNTDDINQNVVVAIAAEIEALLMCGCGVPAPTLTDRFNSITYNNSTTTAYTTTQNTWNTGGQTVASIAPQLDYATGNPTNIAKLICAALRNLLNAIVAQGKEMNQQTADENTDMVNVLSSAMGGLSTAGSAGIAVGGSAAAVVGFFGGPWMVLGLALGAVGLKIATLFMADEPSVFDDAEALEDVLCVMITNTSGGNMTRAKFQGALAGSGFTPGSPQAQIAAMVQPYLDDLTVYLQFLSLGNQLYNVSNFALLPDCGCVDPCLNFKESMHGWQIFPTNFAAWEATKGFKPGAGSPGRIIIYKNENHQGQDLIVIFNQALSGTLRLRNYSNSATPQYQVNFSNVLSVTVPGSAITWTDGLMIQLARNIDNGTIPFPANSYLEEACFD